MFHVQDRALSPKLLGGLLLQLLSKRLKIPCECLAIHDYTLVLTIHDIVMVPVQVVVASASISVATAMPTLKKASIAVVLPL